jgi:hypothetical protein
MKWIVSRANDKQGRRSTFVGLGFLLGMQRALEADITSPPSSRSPRAEASLAIS